MNVLDRILGACPYCHKGHIIKTEKDYVCTARLSKLSTNKCCKFSLSLHTHGIDITDDIVKQLINEGKTGRMPMSENKGFIYDAYFIVDPTDGIVIKAEKKSINALCPDCGGRIIETRYGYACENSISLRPICQFMVSNLICSRYIKSNEAADFCNGNSDILDGFLNKKGTLFSAYLKRNSNGEVALSSVVGKCPVCGGDLLIGSKAFNCANYKRGCHFKIWRHCYGHNLTAQEVQELLLYKQTLKPIMGYSKSGYIHKLQIKLDVDNEMQITSYK